MAEHKLPKLDTGVRFPSPAQPGSNEETGYSPDTDHQSDAEQPPCSSGMKILFGAIRSSPFLVLEDGESVTEDHGCSDSQDHLCQERVEAENISDIHGRTLAMLYQFRFKLDVDRQSIFL